MCFDFYPVFSDRAEPVELCQFDSAAGTCRSGSGSEPEPLHGTADSRVQMPKLNVSQNILHCLDADSSERVARLHGLVTDLRYRPGPQQPDPEDLTGRSAP